MSRKLWIPISRFLLLWLAFLAFWSTPALASKQKKELQKQAKAAEQAKNYEEAELLYCQLRDEDPHNKGFQQKCDEYHQKNEQEHSSDEAHLRNGRAAVGARRFDDAIREFKAVTSKRYRSLAEQWLNQDIPAAQAYLKQEQERKEKEKEETQARNAGEERRFQQGTDAYQKNDFTMAKTLLLDIIGARRDRAQVLIRNIDEYTKNFDEGFKLAQRRKYQQAIERYKAAQRIKEDGPWEIKAKIAQLQHEIKTEADSRNSQPQVTSKQDVGKPHSSSGDQQLLDAISNYYRGAYQQVENDLSGYAGRGSKKALALFYLGASKLTRYYLAGEPKDQSEVYQAAITCFRNAKQSAPDFRPPEQHVSPRIMKVFNEVAR